MSKLFNFENVKELIIKIAEEKGVSNEEMNSDLESWRLSYKRGIVESFQRDLDRLLNSLKLVAHAKEFNDGEAVQYGMVCAAIHASNLSTFFEGLEHDLKHIIRQLSFVSLPQDYKLPPFYNYDV